jgi:hypothetical protein
MDSINFKPPQQIAPGENAFDTHPGAVKHWAEQLPLGNMAESARLLYSALYETNRQVVPLDERLEMLEALSQPLHTILSDILHRLSGQHLPLPSQTRRLAEFSRMLLSEIVIAYQIVLDGEQQGSWFFRLTHHKLWPQCIHRMLHYLGVFYRVQKSLHQPCPAGLWLAIHKLYLEADEHGRRNEMIAMPWQQGQRETIEQQYIQQLLFSLLDPGMLPPPQLALVLERLPQWAELALLLPPERWQPNLPAYWIRLDLDAPHTNPSSQASLHDNTGVPAMLLDLGALHAVIQDMQVDGPEDSTKADKLHAETLALLAKAWDVPIGPRDERTESHFERHVAIGISALFSLMRQENRHSHDGISDQVFSEALQPLVPVPSKPPAGKKSVPANTVWDNIFFATEISMNSWSMDSDEAEYHYINAREIDHSVRGYCLEFRASDLAALDVGELIGFRQHPGGPILLSEVRWIRENQPRIQAGVMSLANELEPILAVMHEEQQRTALACLLGIGLDGHPQLFLPNLPGLAHRQLSLVVDKHEVPIELHQRTAQSPLFIAYHFSLHPSLHDANDLDQGMDLEMLNQRLHQLVQEGPSPAKKDKGDFSDLWKTL